MKKLFMLLFLMVVGFLRANEQQSLVVDVLSNEKHSLKCQLSCKLADRLIGSFVVHKHPIVSYILYQQIIVNRTLKATFGLGNHVSSAAFNGSEDKVVTVSNDRTAKIWDVKSGKCVLRLENDTADNFNSAAFNGAGDKVVTASDDRTAKIWDVGSGECLVTLTGHEGRVNSAAFNGAGDKVVTASDDGTVKIWDVGSGECLVTLTGHEGRVNSAAFNGAGDKVVTASWDGTAKIWDVKSGECLITLTGHEGCVNSAAFNGAGDKVVTASDDGTAKIWDVKSGECLITLTCHKGAVNSAAFNGAGDKVVTALCFPGAKAKIWDVKSGECLVTLRGHTCWLSSAVFNEAGDKVLTASCDCTAKIWDVGACRNTLEYFSRDDKVKATQALLFDAIYEIILCRKWIKKYPYKFYVVNIADHKDILGTIRFDFNMCPHLQEDYEDLPQEIQNILDPFVQRRSQKFEV